MRKLAVVFTLGAVLVTGCGRVSQPSTTASPGAAVSAGAAAPTASDRCTTPIGPSGPAASKTMLPACMPQ